MLDISSLNATAPELYTAGLHLLSKLSFEEMEEISLSQRFTAIASITKAIAQRSTLKASEQETNLLLRISSTVKFGSNFEKTLTHITREAVKQLTETTQDVATWLTIENEDQDARKTLYTRLHNAIIYQAKLAFGNSQTLREKFKSTTLYVGSDETKPSGWVEFNLATKRREIYINQHSEILAKGARESADITIHETMHILCDQFALAYKENPKNIPPSIREEIEALHHSREKNAKIPAYLYSAYRQQLEERIAFTIGDAGSSELIKQLDHFTI
jgi:hypothetical protein